MKGESLFEDSLGIFFYFLCTSRLLNRVSQPVHYWTEACSLQDQHLSKLNTA